MKSKKNWKVIVVVTAVLLALSVSQVFAAIAPSVSQKPAPKTVGAITITDANGNKITINADDIKIVADVDLESLSPEDREVYEKAKAELTAPDSQYSKDLAEYLTKNFPGIDAKNVVVRELFDVSLSDTVVFEEGQKLELTFDSKYKSDDTVMVIVYNKETGKWDFIDLEDVLINPDGTLTVNFPHFSPVAILVADKDPATATATVEADKKNATPPMAEGQEATGTTSSSMVIPVLGLGVLVVVGFLLIKKKRSA